MSKLTHLNDAVQWYVNEMTSRIVAKSGVPSDRFHLGKIILQSLKESDPEMIMQIDGGTNQSENYGSVLKRTVKCANGLRNLGIQKGDIMALMAPNHLDLAIPFYAALYLGIMIAPVDENLGIIELQHTYSIYKPKIIFCQNERVPYIKKAITTIGSAVKIITFDKGVHEYCFSEFLEEFGCNTSTDDFRPTDFDAENTIGFLIPTSGTTGPPKVAAVTHKSFALTTPYLWTRYTQFPTPTRMVVIVAPLQWLSALIHYICAPYMKYPRLQSSLPLTEEHMYYLINTYRPSFLIISPTMMATLIKPGQWEKCDFTCFEAIWLGGSAVPENLIDEVKIAAPETEVIGVYGISEISCMAFQDSPPTKGSCGKRIGLFQYRLMDIETGKEINEANVTGELWLKGLSIFKGYYNNPEATNEALVDGWFKTGDKFYRDENWNYYFVDRFKLLLKYKNHQISPVEVETMIRKHPSVLDVAVTSIPDRECGDLPVACVVTKPGHIITAQEIKDVVKTSSGLIIGYEPMSYVTVSDRISFEFSTTGHMFFKTDYGMQCFDSLSDTKQLRGGVIFTSELPLTATTKLHRQKLKDMALTMKRE